MAGRYRTVTEKDKQEIIHKLKEFVDARKEISLTYTALLQKNCLLQILMFLYI